MGSLLFALVIVFLASFGARDQLLVARISGALGQSGALLGVAVFASAVTAGGMAIAGASISAILPAPQQDLLVAIGLAMAAIELIWPVRLRVQREPTRSYGAIALVMMVRQICDAARLGAFALAAATISAPPVGLGGALGGAGALYLGWSMGDRLELRLPLRAIRLTMGALAILAAILIVKIDY